MTLLDACEPLFQKVCQLNRAGRTGGPTPDPASLRREITGSLDAVRARIAAEPGLERHWAKIEMPLIFFVDSMISESALPAAASWNKQRLAYDFKELAGDQKFFDLLQEHVKDPSDDSTLRLGVFYTCVGLGFTGYLAARPEQLRPLMREMLARIDGELPSEKHLRICPEAYENIDTRDLIQPPPLSGFTLLAFFAGLCVIFVALAFFLYSEATLELRDDLATILSRAMDRWGITIRVTR